jgi:putative phosphoribosyl transferase
LSAYRGRTDVVVLGLARGGVPVGWEVAAGLGAPLDVFLVRKLGVPQWPELAMGAIASGGAVVINESVVQSLHISESQLQEVMQRETAELQRREVAYRGGRDAMNLRGKVVIVVDDGIATGASMRCALQAVRGAAPSEVVVAVPVGPRSECQRLRGDADDVVCATSPARFEAVGQVFGDFHQVSDEEVRALLQTPTTVSSP